MPRFFISINLFERICKSPAHLCYNDKLRAEKHLNNELLSCSLPLTGCFFRLAPAMPGNALNYLPSYAATARIVVQFFAYPLLNKPAA